MSLRDEGVIWYQLPLKVVAAKLHSDLERGLNLSQVAFKHKRYGPNLIDSGRTDNWFRLLLAQLVNPMVLILLGAGVVTLVLGEHENTIVIALVVIVNTLIGFKQEHKSSQIFKSLSRAMLERVTVIRDGEKQTIPSEELVPGDLVYLSAGDFVPADARLASATNFSVDESALTGEWVSIFKSTKEIHKIARLTDQENMVWKGTLVVSGTALALVIATGEATEIGRVASLTSSAPTTETPFQRSVRKLSYFLTVVVLGATGIIFLLGFTRGIPVGESLLTALAVAVAAVPSGLPIAVTVVLAFGVQAIARRGGLIKNLAAVETLGGVSLIMTDKTGTLTKAEMAVENIIPGSDLIADRRDILAMAIMSSDAFLENPNLALPNNKSSEPVASGRPIERALIKAGFDIGIQQSDLYQKETRLDFLPFDSRRRFSASLHQNIENKRDRRIYVTGAPETLLNAAQYYYCDGQAKPLTQKRRRLFLAPLEAENREALRFVATGYLRITRKMETLPHQFNLQGLVFGGLIGVHDPIRTDAAAAVHSAQAAGARVVMVTGDNQLTAASVAARVGIAPLGASVISGDDLFLADGEPVIPAIQDTRIFARMLPEQKLQLLKHFQADGEVIAMTGDGINDAPALKHADIGIALGSGTAVARAAADLVLINDSFSPIIAAIHEGRRILDNLKKIVSYLLSTGFSEIILVGGALVAGVPIPLFPLQIIWNNIIGEGLMTFAFAFEPAEADVLSRRPREHQKAGILNAGVIFLIVVIALVTGLVSLGIYLFLLRTDLPIEKIRTIMFLILSLDSLCFSFSLKNLKRPIWQINFLSNRYLLASFFLSLLILASAFLIPGLHQALHLDGLAWPELGLVVLLGVTNLFLIEVVKYASFTSGWFGVRMNRQRA